MPKQSTFPNLFGFVVEIFLRRVGNLLHRAPETIFSIIFLLPLPAWLFRSFALIPYSCCCCFVVVDVVVVVGVVIVFCWSLTQVYVCLPFVSESRTHRWCACTDTEKPMSTVNVWILKTMRKKVKIKRLRYEREKGQRDRTRKQNCDVDFGLVIFCFLLFVCFFFFISVFCWLLMISSCVCLWFVCVCVCVCVC
jgi:hypothetical protein